ncbi:MAG: NifU family protein [Deltaproteobacteria bacterium]|nr:NifU family protein [Deltaproteobacteria bacterium]
MAEEIFAVDGVAEMLVVQNTITVTKQNNKPWPVIGKEIGQAIRKAFANQNTALLSETLLAKSEDEKNLANKVRQVIEAQVNPAVASHGGYIELLDVKGNDLLIKMGGGCQGCGMAAQTLRQGVEQTLRDAIPHLGSVFDTTDHASGKNPYYS